MLMAVLMLLSTVTGVLLLTLTCLHYIRRTHDARPVLLFWSRRLRLSGGEARCQRLAIILLLAGLVLRYLAPVA